MTTVVAFFIASFKKSIAYRAKIFFQIFYELVLLMVQIYFWKALYATSVNSLAFSFREMLSYLILSRCISVLILDVSYLDSIRNDIRSGEIVNHLTKPYNYMLMYISEVIGRYAASFVFAILPMLLICSLVFHLIAPINLMSLVVSLVLLVLSFAIYFCLNFILGLSIFWVKDSNSLIPIITWSFYEIASGAIVPLQYFPSWIQSILSAMPFKFSVDIPLSIYLGKISLNEGCSYMFQALLWVIILYGFQAIMWKKALRKLTVQGG